MATGAPFSHIKTISQPSSKQPAENEHPQPVTFQKQAYSQETAQIIAAPSPYQPSSLTASLANNSSGTTFAAKARAAELNAVRSRKAAKEAEKENGLPSAGSVALGPVKFTKPRTRAKVWKPLGLNDLLEESVHGDGTSSECTTTTAQSSSQLGQDTEPHHDNIVECRPVQGESTVPQAATQSVSTTVASSQQLQDAKRSCPLEIRGKLKNPAVNGEGSLLSTSDDEQPSRAGLRSITPKLASQGSSSTLIQGHHTALTAERDSQSSAKPGMASSEHSLPDESTGESTWTDMQETRLMKLGVLPALRSAEINGQKSHDDPFVEQPSTMPSSLYNLLAQNQQFNRFKNDVSTLPGSANGLSNGYRPPGFPQLSPSQGSFHPVSKARADREDSAHVPTPNNQAPRDAKPYGSFAAAKKELLLKNLDDVVASSMMYGNLPTATRTVLYDPAAREAGKPALDPLAREFLRAAPGEGGNPHGTAAGKESLKASDPLPWTNRPVNIHDSASPLAPSAQWPLITHPSSMKMPLIMSMDGSIDDASAPFLNGLNYAHGVPINFEQASVVNEEAVEDQGSTYGDGVHFSGSNGKTPVKTGAAGSMAGNLPISWLMEAAYHNLRQYLDKPGRDYFGRYGRVPEWCIDKSPGGDQSFFGDWGAWGPPPPRVGRDPRYRPTFHEGRYTVFEEIGRRGGREGLMRRYH